MPAAWSPRAARARCILILILARLLLILSALVLLFLFSDGPAHLFRPPMRVLRSPVSVSSTTATTQLRRVPRPRRPTLRTKARARRLPRLIIRLLCCRPTRFSYSAPSGEETSVEATFARSNFFWKNGDAAPHCSDFSRGEATFRFEVS